MNHGHVCQQLSDQLETANTRSVHTHVLDAGVGRALCEAGVTRSQGPGLKELAF